MNRILLFVAIALVIGADTAEMPKMPSLKEGVWLIRIQTIQHPSGEQNEISGKVCQKADWNNGPMKVKTPKGKCKSTFESNGTTQKYQMECEVSGVGIKVTETREITDENTGRTVVDTSYSPAVDGVTGATIISEAKYVSACPTGVKPGSHMMPDGTFAQKDAK